MTTTLVTCLGAGEAKTVYLLVCWNESQVSLSGVGIQYAIPGMSFFFKVLEWDAFQPLILLSVYAQDISM